MQVKGSAFAQKALFKALGFGSDRYAETRLPNGSQICGHFLKQLGEKSVTMLIIGFALSEQTWLVSSFADFASVVGGSNSAHCASSSAIDMGRIMPIMGPAARTEEQSGRWASSSKQAKDCFALHTLAVKPFVSEVAM